MIMEHLISSSHFSVLMGFKDNRDYVRPDDLTRYYEEWDQLIESAIVFAKKVAQPLQKFMNDEQVQKLNDVVEKKMNLPSVKTNYFEQRA